MASAAPEAIDAPTEPGVVVAPEGVADALAQPGAQPVEDVPHLAGGIDLIGRFEDSGLREPPFIARRRDGQVVQMPELLFRLAEQIDGQADVETIAERFSERIQRQVQPADAAMLIDEQLRPLGIVAQPDDASVELNKVDPLLALKFRAAVIPDTAVRAITTVFRPLFAPVVVVAVVAGLLGVDAWLFLVHGISQSLRHVIYQPLLMLMLLGGVVVATAFHEIGHASAVRYGGARPGVMGVGIYIVWPAFYTDITDAYRLDKRGRLRADLGGVYFNAIFALVVVGAYAATRFEPLLLLILLQNFAILQQALPFLRLDGYYVLSDLTGVPDIFLRIKPVLASFIPGRPPDQRVTELKSRVRAVVSVYVVAVVAFLGLTVVLLVINLPRLASTGYDSAALRYDAVGPAFSSGHAATGVVDVVQMIFLILPAAGLVLTAARVGRRAGGGALRWSHGHPARRASLALAGAAAATLAALSWWPNGEYRPIQPGERGTLQGAIGQVAAIPSARPSLTLARQRQLGGAPTERQRRRLARAAQLPRPPAGGRHRPASANPATRPGTTSAPATTTVPVAPTGATGPGTGPPTATSPATTPPSGSTTTTTQSSSTSTTPGSDTTSTAASPPGGSTNTTTSTAPGGGTP
jgi:putative peptide zinc metalloprotease protein